jgi:aarF domain-containing kinase
VVHIRAKPRLTFIDAGIVTELTSQDRRNFVDLFYAIATGRWLDYGPVWTWIFYTFQLVSSTPHALLVPNITGQGEEAGRLMIERARQHECKDPDGFCSGIGKIVKEAVGSHLKLGGPLDSMGCATCLLGLA